MRGRTSGTAYRPVLYYCTYILAFSLGEGGFTLSLARDGRAPRRLGISSSLLVRLPPLGRDGLPQCAASTKGEGDEMKSPVLIFWPCSAMRYGKIRSRRVSLLTGKDFLFWESQKRELAL